MSKTATETKALVPVFDLVVSELTIGTLITNAKEVHDSIIDFLETCDVENYKGTVKDAATDKAKFNALAKKLNDERIRLEKVFLKPFVPFKEIVSETTDAIKKISSGLDVIVKAKEKEEKEAKKAEIVEIWKTYDFSLVSLEKIFNEKWLNKTYKTKQIHDDIAHIIDRITGDLQSIEQFGEDTATLKELYLTTLDLQATLRRGAELRENRKRLAEEEAKKAQIKAQSEAEPEYVKTNSHVQPPESVSTENTVDRATEEEKEEARNTSSNEPCYTFYVTMPIAEIAKSCGIKSQPILMSATKEQLLNFKAAMEKHGYEYEKLIYGNKLLLNVRYK